MLFLLYFLYNKCRLKRQHKRLLYKHWKILPTPHFWTVVFLKWHLIHYEGSDFVDFESFHSRMHCETVYLCQIWTQQSSVVSHKTHNKHTCACVCDNLQRGQFLQNNMLFYCNTGILWTLLGCRQCFMSLWMLRHLDQTVSGVLHMKMSGASSEYRVQADWLIW